VLGNQFDRSNELTDILATALLTPEVIAKPFTLRNPAMTPAQSDRIASAHTAADAKLSMFLRLRASCRALRVAALGIRTGKGKPRQTAKRQQKAPRRTAGL
jgi:hypothetical protein